jgi:GDPmannose 4,6-dehydratase
MQDYVRMQWLMLQQEKPDDFVIATGKQISVRDFVSMSARFAGMELCFSGEGVNEVGHVVAVDNNLASNVRIGQIVVRVDARYFRPSEVETLLGDATKAKQLLNWEPEVSVEELCSEMVASDLNKARSHALLKSHGYDITVSQEN